MIRGCVDLLLFSIIYLDLHLHSAQVPKNVAPLLQSIKIHIPDPQSSTVYEDYRRTDIQLVQAEIKTASPPPDPSPPPSPSLFPQRSPPNLSRPA